MAPLPLAARGLREAHPARDSALRPRPGIEAEAHAVAPLVVDVGHGAAEIGGDVTHDHAFDARPRRGARRAKEHRRLDRLDEGIGHVGRAADAGAVDELARAQVHARHEILLVEGVVVMALEREARADAELDGVGGAHEAAPAAAMALDAKRRRARRLCGGADVIAVVDLGAEAELRVGVGLALEPRRHVAVVVAHDHPGGGALLAQVPVPQRPRRSAQGVAIAIGDRRCAGARVGAAHHQPVALPGVVEPVKQALALHPARDEAPVALAVLRHVLALGVAGGVEGEVEVGGAREPVAPEHRAQEIGDVLVLVDAAREAVLQQRHARHHHREVAVAAVAGVVELNDRLEHAIDRVAHVAARRDGAALAHEAVELGAGERRGAIEEQAVSEQGRRARPAVDAEERHRGRPRYGRRRERQIGSGRRLRRSVGRPRAELDDGPGEGGVVLVRHVEPQGETITLVREGATCWPASWLALLPLCAVMAVWKTAPLPSTITRVL
jgi:hypothetical protein